MAAFNTKKELKGNVSLIPVISERLESSFISDGFTVTKAELYNGGYDISIAKGELFKAVLGMKTALKITLTPNGDGILFDAGIGIFGMQLIPTLISWYVAWPVLIAQIWGIVKQSKLDDKALEIAEAVINEHASDMVVNRLVSDTDLYCLYCGKTIPVDSAYCPFCGKKNSNNC